MSSACSRGKAGFLWKLEVLEALARLGVCLWGRGWLRPPEEGMESLQAWGQGGGWKSCRCAAAVPADAQPSVGQRQLSGLGARSLVNEGGVSCCCWAGGNYFQLSLEWETLAREEDCWLLRCDSAEQAPPVTGLEGERVTPTLAVAAAVVATEGGGDAAADYEPSWPEAVQGGKPLLQPQAGEQGRR